ncbi:MAG: choice-of-anchor Q domain-containing protein [Anaerolineales bacterium]
MFFSTTKTTSIMIGLAIIIALGMQGITPAQASTEPLQAGTIYRVTVTGTTSDPCGTDWSTPCDLQYALSIAAPGAEIWVASGTYYPDRGTNQTVGARESTFSLHNGVAIYGGFTGTESLLSQRNSNPAQNGTILSGDIGTTGINSDNSYHVVQADSVSSSAILDGFTITGGNADGSTENFGGGLFINESSLKLKNIIFSGNRTNGSGGGMFVISQRTIRTEYSSPELINVIFENNIAAVRGAGLATQNSSPSLLNVTFKNNTTTAGPGGGMANWTLYMPGDEYSEPILVNVTFSGNSADGGGGLFNSNSNPILTNVTFSGNSASLRGGAIYNDGASPDLNNVTISGNTAPAGYGGAIRNVTFMTVQSNPVIKNSIFWGDTSEEITDDGTGSGTIIDSVVQGGCPTGASCTNIITTNPVLSALANNGDFTQTRALGKGSSAINAGGINSPCASDDQRGADRSLQAPCDIGAFEAYLLTVNANSKTITYGMPEPTYTVHYDGLLGSDTGAMIDTPPTCGVAGPHTNANTYTITCSGGTDDKYVLFAYVNGTLTINKATPTISVTNSPRTYNTTAQTATVIGSVPGTPSNILMDGLASQTDAGTYAVTANFTPNDTTNYNSLVGASAGNFVINKATPVLSATILPETYTGSSYKGLDYKTSIDHSVPGIGSVSGTISNVLFGGSATQTNAGTYLITADFTPDDLSNYNSLVNASAGNFVINKATPTLSVTNSPLTYDALFHTATISPSVVGTVSNILVGGATSQKNASTYAVTANFIPTDTSNYNSLTNAPAGNLVIEKATPILSVTNSPLLYNGSPRSAAVASSVLGSVSNILTGAAATQTNAGTYAVTANFTPSDTTNYNTLTNASAGNFVINKITPILSVTNSPVLHDEQPHTPIVASSVAGTVSNVLADGSVSQIEIGTYAVTANFTPTDAVNYMTLVDASAGNFVISPDITPPGTQINFYPMSPSGWSVTFAFSSEDGTATFECQIDGTSYAACISPKTYTDLEGGSHTFSVHAIDPVGNVDATPASYTWTVTAHQQYYMESRVITPMSIIPQSGSTNGAVSRLWYLEQLATDDTASAYVNFQTQDGTYFDYQSFYIPENIQTNFISDALLQINFNGTRCFYPEMDLVYLRLEEGNMDRPWRYHWFDRERME